MDNTPNWNFPDNNYTRAAGFGTSDVETFQKEPIAYFAREICQNSIDARIRGSSQPVRIEFKTFKVHRDQIPGFNDLYSEVKNCLDYIKTTGKEEYIEVAEKILNSFGDNDNPYITCLRVSDFNTTGLYGVKTNSPGLPFFELTRGTGSSNKSGTSAGSKGIGKYASFVASKSKTVFYSTRACNPENDEIEVGHIGVSKLCARKLNDMGLFTQGDGYYGIDKYNYPIHEELYLDPSFKRGDNEFGADVFIIGFTDDTQWKDEIIRKILESFMVAIVYETLEVIVGDVVVNKDTVRNIVKELKEQSPTRENKNIVSQYELLTTEGESIHKKPYLLMAMI